MDGRIASLVSGPDRIREAKRTMPLSRYYESFLARRTDDGGQTTEGNEGKEGGGLNGTVLPVGRTCG